MKKKFSIFFILVMVAAFIFGCKPAIKQYDEIISEIRSNLYEGSIEQIKVDAITGLREEPFEINGHTNEKQSFTVITIYPIEYNPGEKYSYKAEIDGVDYSGDMLKHPFNNTYSAEIETFSESAEIKFSLKHKGIEKSSILTSVIGEGFIDSEKALEIALKKLSSSIRTFKSNNISYEIYIRLLENPISSSGGFHWYVAFVGENDVTYAVLIEPVTLDIVAIRD